MITSCVSKRVPTWGSDYVHESETEYELVTVSMCSWVGCSQWVKWCKQNVIAALRISTVGAAGSCTHIPMSTHTQTYILAGRGWWIPAVSVLSVGQDAFTGAWAHRQAHFVYECVKGTEVFPWTGPPCTVVWMFLGELVNMIPVTLRSTQREMVTPFMRPKFRHSLGNNHLMYSNLWLFYNP